MNKKNIIILYDINIYFNKKMMYFSRNARKGLLYYNKIYSSSTCYSPTIYILNYTYIVSVFLETIKYLGTYLVIHNYILTFTTTRDFKQLSRFVDVRYTVARI